MDQTETVTRQLRIYLNKVSQSIPIERAYLVGSHAKGHATTESDVDVLIISPQFAAMDPDQRLDLLYRLSVGVGLELHLLAVTPQELAGASRLTTLGAIRRERKIVL